MFNYEEFMAKATLYFGRAAEAEDSSDEQAIWLLLGLEFLLRAPLARVHPTLLAMPEGDSILHAAGIERARGIPKSIPIKSVIDRLTKVDPNFGEDRGKDAAFLTELRNEELHSSRATLATTEAPAWMAKFLDVVEAICTHLEIEPVSLLGEDMLTAAQEYRATDDAKTKGAVQKLFKTAKTVFEGLSPAEVGARRERSSPTVGAVRIECPACAQRAAWLGLTQGRTTEPTLDDAAQEIHYKIVRAVSSLHCDVCNLTLTTPAQVLAAGISRLHVDEVSEDRYEGWEELMTYEDALDFIGAGEEYENE